MLLVSKDQIEKYFEGLEIIKEFPPSGQKKVLLVKHEEYGISILKIVMGGSERVLREIDIVTEFNLANVPKILSVKNIVINESLYLVIFEQYIEGLTLDDRLKQGKLSLIEGVNLLKTLLHISVILEKIKVVHRDIKPSNIICAADSKYYLIDFGIARQLDKVSLTFTHMKVGPHTPGYGAPELFQYSKKDIDSRSDLFSIGVVLFESLTGEHPFMKGDEIDVNEIWYKTNTIEAKNYRIEGDKNLQLIGFIQTLMQKHVTRRPPTAKKALEWFDALLPTLDLGGN